MAKSKTEKAAKAVKEAAVEAKDDIVSELDAIVKKLGIKSAELQRESKVSAAKHCRNAVKALRFVISELEK